MTIRPTGVGTARIVTSHAETVYSLDDAINYSSTSDTKSRLDSGTNLPQGSDLSAASDHDPSPDAEQKPDTTDLLNRFSSFDLLRPLPLSQVPVDSASQCS